MRAILDVVLPVFGLILAGFLAGRFRVLGQGSTEALNSFVYFFALPALLFVGMARTPVVQVLNGPFLAVYCGGIVIAATIVVLVARAAFPGRMSELALAALGGSYSNTGYMGIPLFLTAYGAAGLTPVLIGAVVNSAAMVGVVVALIEFEAKGAAGARAALGHAAKSLAVNPLVIAPLAGVFYNAVGLTLPTPVATFCDLLGAAAGPGALFAVGLFLASRPLGALVGGRAALEVSWLIFVKLAIYPAATWALAVLFGLDPFWTAAATIMAALPTGALSFVIASNYSVYVERSSAVILGSTILSVLTLSALFVAFAGVRP